VYGGNACVYQALNNNALIIRGQKYTLFETLIMNRKIKIRGDG
jgi:hypothetical protein